jgi:hypothetical protein
MQRHAPTYPSGHPQARMQQSRLAAKKLTASTKSTPRELRPIPYDLIGPTALRAHTSEIVCRGAGAAGMLVCADRSNMSSMALLTLLALS